MRITKMSHLRGFNKDDEVNGNSQITLLKGYDQEILDSIQITSRSVTVLQEN